MLLCRYKRLKCYFQGWQQEVFVFRVVVVVVETKDLDGKRFGVVGGLQECFNVGSIEEKVELKIKKQFLFFLREVEFFCFYVFVICFRIFQKVFNYLNKYLYGCLIFY